MPAIKHIHTFERFRKNPESKHYGGTYKCVHPGCSSFYKHDMLAGKKAKCKCGQEFTINPKIHFHLKNMVCANCSGDKRQKRIAAAEEFAEAIINAPSLTTITADTLPAPEMEIVLEEPKPEPMPEQPDLFEEEEQENLFEVERT